MNNLVCFPHVPHHCYLLSEPCRRTFMLADNEEVGPPGEPVRYMRSASLHRRDWMRGVMTMHIDIPGALAQDNETEPGGFWTPT